AELPWRQPGLQRAAQPRGGPRGPRPGTRQHAVHAAAGRLRRAAATLQRPARPAHRRAPGQPQPRRVRRPDRAVRQHPGAARAVARQRDL
nr:hypothetical protein [Tanacetum cinerariifolium]